MVLAAGGTVATGARHPALRAGRRQCLELGLGAVRPLSIAVHSAQTVVLGVLVLTAVLG